MRKGLNTKCAGGRWGGLMGQKQDCDHLAQKVDRRAQLWESRCL